MIQVTVEDLTTGDKEVKVFDNDYLLICAGNKHLEHTQDYPTKGTTILTIKTTSEEK